MDQPSVGLSLFAGLGSLDIAARRAFPGYVTRALVEREAYAVAVLAARMEDGALDPAPIWAGAIEQLDYADLDGAGIDTIVAGFPCQPASVAGGRGGTDDARWLWPEVVRAARELRVRWLLLENVPGILTVSAGLGYQAILGDLAALGLHAEWGCLRASDVGATHRRERWFLVGELADAGREDQRRGRADGGDERRDADASGRHEGADPVAAYRGAVGYRDGASSHPHAEGGRPWRAAGEPGRSVVDAASNGRREGRTEPEFRSGRGAAGQPNGTVATQNGLAPYPPSPNDRDGWARVLAARPDLAPAVEPGFRELADGSAAGLDLCLCSRADRLRALGNSVVVDQAATAFHALWERLSDA